MGSSVTLALVQLRFADPWVKSSTPPTQLHRPFSAFLLCHIKETTSPHTKSLLPPKPPITPSPRGATHLSHGSHGATHIPAGPVSADNKWMAPCSLAQAYGSKRCPPNGAPNGATHISARLVSADNMWMAPCSLVQAYGWRLVLAGAFSAPDKRSVAAGEGLMAAVHAD